VRIDNETADEPVTHIARKNSKERRNDVLMPPDDQELPLAALQGLPQYGRGIGIVMAGKLEDALADPVGLQPVPAAVPGAARPGRCRLSQGVDPGAGYPENPRVLPVHDRDMICRAALQGC